ncbi:hypothetical protein HYQ46_003945 [Verticillium longisporum]|nr:hypothetical protein HYQ46_003945 [Verticillium longisporum]
MEKGVTPITERFASVHTEAVSKALNDAFPALEEQAEAEDAGDCLRRRVRHGKQAHCLLYRPALQPPTKGKLALCTVGCVTISYAGADDDDAALRVLCLQTDTSDSAGSSNDASGS